jgi:hypothetical protein
VEVVLYQQGLQEAVMAMTLYLAQLPAQAVAVAVLFLIR